MLLLLWHPASGDAILGGERTLLMSVLSQGRSLYSFVPATLAADNWAARELQALRSVQRAVPYTESATMAAFGKREFGSDGGTDELDPFRTLAIRAGETPAGAGMLAATGEQAFAAPLSAWGLSLADMQMQLPELAITMGSYIDFLNNASVDLIRRLRALLLGNVSLKGTPAMDSLGTRHGVAGPATVPGGGGDEAKRKEDLQTTKRVVRSVLKIILGFLLGVLLWMLVSRM